MFLFLFSRFLPFALIFLSTPDSCFSHFAQLAALSAAAFGCVAATFARLTLAERREIQFDLGSSCIGEPLAYIWRPRLWDLSLRLRLRIAFEVKANSVRLNLPQDLNYSPDSRDETCGSVTSCCSLNSGFGSRRLNTKFPLAAVGAGSILIFIQEPSQFLLLECKGANVAKRLNQTSKNTVVPSGLRKKK